MKKEANEHLMPTMSKAYDNREFIHSMDGRTIRLLAEYLYPEQFFRKNSINKTIAFFGSARVPAPEDYKEKTEALQAALETAAPEDKTSINEEIKKLERFTEMTESYADACRLAEMLSEWSMTLQPKDRYYICTGGGPGMMEAANRGARQAGSPNIGLNISLPFEQHPNPYITPSLNFEFHYFFMRKFWFVYLTRAVVALPGGFGTMDELFELLTLKQTKKVRKPIPIVLYNEKFWRKLFNFEYLVEIGMINKADLDLFHYSDSPEDAFDFITTNLKKFNNI